MKRILFLLTLILAITPAFAQDWIDVGQAVYLDKDSIIANRPLR